MRVNSVRSALLESRKRRLNIGLEMTDNLSLLSRKDLIEKLAAIEHDRWAHWQSYLHEQCVRQEDGSLIIPAKLAERWEKQIATPYTSLSDEEKNSDREQVYRYLPVIESELSSDWR